MGRSIAYCDPYVQVARRWRKHDLNVSSVPCTGEEFARQDAVLVAMAHSAFKDPELYAHAKMVIDTRNIIPRGLTLPVIRA